MTDAPAKPLTVKWVLFGFSGRIGRKSFWLGALFMILIQAAIISRIVTADQRDPLVTIFALMLLAVWLVSAFVALALSVKRLHDVGMPGILAVLILFPPVAFLFFLFLAFMPSQEGDNEYGAQPFPSNGQDD